ncbi:MAG TPA: PEP-CTERM sorting domain-containing protein [Candidatus Sulfotelmatobacter sp.]|nr:PEP-CTERM sorting domain-containing protein [Candidatus Sulfotelmatobacter sp.]
MRALTFGIVAFLAFVPCLKADVLQVTSGFIQTYGEGGATTFLAGDGFTATGVVNFTGACPATVQAGSPITGCAGFDWISGQLTVVKNGVSQQLQFGNDFATTITQAPLFISNVTQATLSESATISNFSACPNVVMFPTCPTTTFVLPQDIFFSISLAQDPSSGNLGVQMYDVKNEIYSFPEPGTLVLLGSGVGLLALIRRKTPFIQHETKKIQQVL